MATATRMMAPSTPTVAPTPLGGNEVTGVVQDKNAGANTLVNINGLILTGSDAGNYVIHPSPTTSATITPAVLDIVAADVSRDYGQPNPMLSAGYSGFVNGETLATSGVTGSPVLTSPARDSSVPGSYPITVAIGSLSASNYGFAAVNGTLSVVPAPVPTSTTGINSPSSSVVGQSVTLVASVGTNLQGADPTGMVVFHDGAMVLGTGPVSSGQATFTTSDLSSGPHRLWMEYPGDANYQPGQSTPLDLQVQPAFTATRPPVPRPRRPRSRSA